MTVTVKSFVENLKPHERDVFVGLMGDLYASSRREKIDRLKAFLEKLRGEIEEINKRREAIGVTLNTVKTVRGYVERAPDKGVELELFRERLMSIEQELKTEVNDLYPANKLEKKLDVTRRIEHLLARQALAELTMTDVLGKKPAPPYAQGRMADAAEGSMPVRREDVAKDVEERLEKFPQPPKPAEVMAQDDDEDEGE